eukprot:7385093-Prymnesium_polylepis.1
MRARAPRPQRRAPINRPEAHAMPAALRQRWQATASTTCSQLQLSSHCSPIASTFCGKPTAYVGNLNFRPRLSRCADRSRASHAIPTRACLLSAHSYSPMCDEPSTAVRCVCITDVPTLPLTHIRPTSHPTSPPTDRAARPADQQPSVWRPADHPSP